MKDSTEIFINLKPEAKHIFNLLQKNGYMTKNDISSIANIKLTTLNYIMQPLEKAKIIVEKSIGESSGGRKPILYDVNMCNYYIIGINISTTYTQVVITNFKMELLYKESFSISEPFSPEEIVKNVVNIINKAYIELNLDYIKLLGIGLGISNCLSKITSSAGHPLDADIKSMLEESLDCPVIFDNSSNSAAVAEYFYGIGKGFKNIAYFNCDNGVKSATISSGKLVRTLNNDENTFGHMIIDIHGDLCSCGNYGCIDSYISVNSILKKYKDEIKVGRTTILNKPPNEINFVDFCTAVKSKDTLATEITLSSATILGTGLANYINLLSPELIILNGSLVMDIELFYNKCISVTLKKLHSNSSKKVIFSRGGYFKDDTTAVGAAALVVERILDSGI